MTDIFRLADDFGPAKVIHVRQPILGFRYILVVDNVATGPSISGPRMAPDVSVGECAWPDPACQDCPCGRQSSSGGSATD